MKHWRDKFRNAFRGLRLGIVGQSSFSVHFPVALLVLATAGLLRCSLIEFCLLLLCIGLVLSLELMNSAVEYLARGLCKEHNVHVGYALDIASSAVLVAAIVSSIVGVAVLGQRCVALF
jgi:diacylglycerol kinase